jgi:EAL domain-containing protein (putative c-di-GMP-specific phosphodiesterase class I)
MADTDAAIALLRRLRDHGFQIAMDDFGTGYSSLSYLRELPITMLKIDQSFVAHLAEDGDAHAIAASIVDLARAVGVTVVAEGVETAQQAALLRRLGCKAGQGWLWSTARAAQDLRPTGPWISGFEPVDGALSIPPRPRHVPPAATLEHGVERLLALHREGASLATVAAALNAEGFRTPTGVRWHSTSVARTVAEYAAPIPDDGPLT